MAAPAPADQAATGTPGRSGSGPWRSIMRFPARIPLRIKLIAALLTLVIAGLAVASITGIFVLRGYLEGHADNEVTSALNKIMGGGGPAGHQAGGLTNGFFAGFPYVSQLRNTQGDLVAIVNNTTIVTQKPSAGMPSIPTGQWLNANVGHLITVGAVDSTDKWRVITQPYTIQVYNTVTNQPQDLTFTLVVGVDLGDVDHTIGRLVGIDLVVGGIVVFCLAIIGIAVVRASLLPLTEIEQTAGKIAAGDLTQRVAERDPGTEVGSLGRSLNVMLARIETAFHAQATSEANARRSENRMRRFIADASHELRTPLTTIRGYAEYYRQRGGATTDGNGQLGHDDLDRIMHRVESEATRMGVLVEDLLLLARIDQQRPLEQHPVDVLALAADAVQDARMIAPGREVTLNVGRDTAFLVLGDEARLRQVIGNLTSNALTHTPDGTPVEVNLRSGQIGWGPNGPVAIAGSAIPPGLIPPPPGAANHLVPAVVIEVTDHGPGLPADQAQRVFERFYRADEARTRQTGGTGLGLAIVSALVTAHSGAVGVQSVPGQGATFRVALPLAPEAQGGGEDEDGSDAESLAGGVADGGGVAPAEEADVNEQGVQLVQGHPGPPAAGER
jgi:two-component system OmpR family sensor kinase